MAIVPLFGASECARRHHQPRCSVRWLRPWSVIVIFDLGPGVWGDLLKAGSYTSESGSLEDINKKNKREFNLVNFPSSVHYEPKLVFTSFFP